MARIRTIKPEFFTSLTIASLPIEARLTFIGLWTHVDDEGRCVDDARLVKAALWPLDDRLSADVERDLRVISESSLIVRYKVGARSFIAIRTWGEHQRINRPTRSKLPPPSPGDEAAPSGEPATPPPAETSPPPAQTPPARDSSPQPHPQLTEDSRQERNREQGTGKGTGNRDTPAPAGRDDPAFDEFWSTYPRREAKGAARKAWDKAIKRAEPTAIIAGAALYRDRPGREPQYTAHPATWLNADRWSDEPVRATNRANGYESFRNPEDVEAAYGGTL